jgi:hypothetical protein
MRRLLGSGSGWRGGHLEEGMQQLLSQKGCGRCPPCHLALAACSTARPAAGEGAQESPTPAASSPPPCQRPPWSTARSKAVRCQLYCQGRRPHRLGNRRQLQQGPAPAAAAGGGGQSLKGPQTMLLLSRGRCCGCRPHLLWRLGSPTHAVPVPPAWVCLVTLSRLHLHQHQQGQGQEQEQGQRLLQTGVGGVLLTTGSMLASQSNMCPHG